MSYGIDVVGPMVINVGDASEVILDQVEGNGVNFNPQKEIKSSAGDLDPTFAGYRSFAPVFNGNSEACASFLAACGILGKIPIGTGLDLYNRAVDLATGGRKTGGNHQKFTMASCLIVPKSLKVSGDSPAKIDFEVIGINAAGDTNPVVKTEGASLPSMNGVQEQFYLGKVMINGTELEGIQDLTIDFGLQVVTKKQGGKVYPQIVYYGQRRPKLMIKTDNAGALAQIGIAGLLQSATDSMIYLRKGVHGGTRVADATTQHISFGIDDGIWTAPEKSGSHPSELGTSIECDPTYDGSNPIIAISTATAIP